MDLHRAQHVGQRVSVNGYRGTIKYIGPVQDASGTWLGVEWDDPDRGKHSGKGYFHSDIPGAASFIRPSKTIDEGCSFFHALCAKYIDDSQNTSTGSETLTLGSSNGFIQVEAVGLDKIRRNLSQLDRLRVIGLDSCSISSDDQASSSMTVMPNVTSLDLSRNLLSTWQDVGEILTHVPNLETLTLNGNRLASLTHPLAPFLFGGLLNLQLNALLISWSQLSFILPSMPRLVSLELALNRLRQLDAGSSDPHQLLPKYANIVQLNLDSNFLSSWRGCMEAASSFSRLQNLILSGNGFTSIERIPKGLPPLSSIISLSLSDNGLASWESVDNLAEWLPSLQSLHIAGNPLVEVTGYKIFARLVTARLPQLAKLNGTQVSHNERVDSERYYLIQIEKDHPGAEDPEKSVLHPRREELLRRHGPPSQNETQIKSTKLGSRLMCIKVFFSDRPPDQTSPPHEVLEASQSKQLKVLPNMSIGSFVLKVRKAYNQSRSTRLAFWIMFDGEAAGAFAPLDLSRSDRDVELVGLENGSTLLCCPNVAVDQPGLY